MPEHERQDLIERILRNHRWMVKAGMTQIQASEEKLARMDDAKLRRLIEIQESQGCPRESAGTPQ